MHLSKSLLEDNACKYLLLGILQTDPLESEFGIYRQASGGNYFIAYEQVLQTAGLRRIELLHRLELQESIANDESFHPSRDCCAGDLEESELELVDELPDVLGQVELREKQSLLYVCGYISYKEKIPHDKEHILPQECSEFTSLVSRGKLSYPPGVLFDFSVYCYAFFKTNSTVHCTRRLSRIFEFIAEAVSFRHGSYARPVKFSRTFQNSSRFFPEHGI